MRGLQLARILSQPGGFNLQIDTSAWFASFGAMLDRGGGRGGGAGGGGSDVALVEHQAYPNNFSLQYQKRGRGMAPLAAGGDGLSFFVVRGTSVAVDEKEPPSCFGIRCHAIAQVVATGGARPRCGSACCRRPRWSRASGTAASATSPPTSRSAARGSLRSVPLGL
jgi:hypothetical protein